MNKQWKPYSQIPQSRNERVSTNNLARHILYKLRKDEHSMRNIIIENQNKKGDTVLSEIQQC